MKKRFLVSAALSLLLLQPLAAKKNNPTVLDVSQSITDNAIIYPESFEIDTQKLLEGWYMKNYAATDDNYRTKDDTNPSDEVIIQRLQAMPTVIEMPYNQIVRSYIDRYTKKGRAQVAAMLGLSNYYMPIFEQALEQEGLPLELKYLPVIESGLDPNAVSKSGAAGLWQFMLGSAKGLGMDVSSLVDERRDPYISSEKAAKFLKDLYATYGDWSLCIAAYNCGPGTVNKAIRRAGGDPKSHDFWSIYNYLPSETRGYVPAFIAANYVMTYYKDHNISPVLATKPLVTDTIAIQERIHFDQISNVLSIPVEELQVLNPQFRQNVIPGSPDHPYYLILPSQQIHAYIMSEDQIREYEAAKYNRRETVEPGDQPFDASLGEVASADTFVALDGTPVTDNSEEELAEVQQAAAEKSNRASSNANTKTVMHKVGNGETLNSIAEKYGVQAGDIKQWNGLRRSAVRPGQQLKILVAADSPAASPAKSAKNNEPKASKPAKAAPANNYANDEDELPAAQPKKSSKKQKQETQPAQQQQKQQANSKKSKKQQEPQQQANAKNSKNNKKAKKQEAPKPTTVEVKSGENLTTIAKKHGCTVDELKKANNMKDDKLRAGQNLTIPAKKNATSKSKASKSSKNQNSSGNSTTKKSKKKKR